MSLITPEQRLWLPMPLGSMLDRTEDLVGRSPPAVIDARSTTCDYCPYRDACVLTYVSPVT